MERDLLEKVHSSLNKILADNPDCSRKIKLSIIKMITDLNIRLALLDLKEGRTTLKDLKKAAESLGKKSQSAFNSENKKV